MKRTYRWFSLLLCLLMGMAALGCVQTEESIDRPKVLVTVFPAYDFVRALAGDLVTVEMLVSPGNEVHGFEPTFQQLANIRQSDLFVYVGGDSDAWASDLAENGGVPNDSLRLMDVVPLICTETHDHEHGLDHSDAYDEHVWTSPKNAKAIVEALSEKLMECLPNEAEILSERTEAYLSELDALMGAFSETVSNGTLDTIVFAERFPFRYLCEELELTAHSALHGCSGNEEVSLNTMQALIDVIKDEGLPVVFYIEFSDQRIAKILSEATGATPMLLHSCHNVTKEEFAEGETYLSLMWDNVEALGKAVNGWHS